jgi:hypothetical protein
MNQSRSRPFLIMRCITHQFSAAIPDAHGWSIEFLFRIDFKESILAGGEVSGSSPLTREKRLQKSHRQETSQERKNVIRFRFTLMLRGARSTIAGLRKIGKFVWLIL